MCLQSSCTYVISSFNLYPIATLCITMVFVKNKSWIKTKKLCAKLKSDRNCSRSPGSGRKRKHLIEVIVKFLTSNILNRVLQRKRSYSVSDQLQAQNGVKVSSKTIQWRVKEKGIKWRKKIKKPSIKEKNKKTFFMYNIKVDSLHLFISNCK